MWRYYETYGGGRPFYQQTGRTHETYSYTGAGSTTRDTTNSSPFLESTTVTQEAGAGHTETRRSYPGLSSYTESTGSGSASSSRKLGFTRNFNVGSGGTESDSFSSASSSSYVIGETREGSRYFFTYGSTTAKTDFAGVVESASTTGSITPTTYSSTTAAAVTGTVTEATTTSRAESTATTTKTRTVHASTSKSTTVPTANTSEASTTTVPTTTRATVTDTRTTLTTVTADITRTIYTVGTFARSDGVDTVVEAATTDWLWSLASSVSASGQPVSDAGSSFTKATFSTPAGSTAVDMPGAVLAADITLTGYYFGDLFLDTSLHTGRYTLATASASESYAGTTTTTATRTATTITGDTASVGDFAGGDSSQLPAPNNTESAYQGGTTTTAQFLTLTTTRTASTASWTYTAGANALRTYAATYTYHVLGSDGAISVSTLASTWSTLRANATDGLDVTASIAAGASVAAWGTSRSTQELESAAHSQLYALREGGADWSEPGAPFGWMSAPGTGETAGTNLAPSAAFPIPVESALIYQSPLNPWEGPIGVSVPILYTDARTGEVDDDGTYRTITTRFDPADSSIHATTSTTTTQTAVDGTATVTQTITETGSTAFDLLQEGTVTRAPYYSHQPAGQVVGVGGWGWFTGDALVITITGGVAYTHRNGTTTITTGAVLAMTGHSTIGVSAGEDLVMDRLPLALTMATTTAGDASTISFSAFPVT